MKEILLIRPGLNLVQYIFSCLKNLYVDLSSAKFSSSRQDYFNNNSIAFQVSETLMRCVKELYF